MLYTYHVAGRKPWLSDAEREASRQRHLAQTREWQRRRRNDPIERERDREHTRSYYPTLTAEARLKHAETTRAWKQSHRERVNELNRAERYRTRKRVLDFYGDSRCACCGETTEQFLAIDHIDGNGNEHRRSIGRTAGMNFYRWLVKQDFPPGYRVLCHNCNWAFGHYGSGPHAATNDPSALKGIQ